MIYRVLFTETIAYEFDVEADSIEEVRKEFDRMVIENEIDFSDGEIVDTELEVLLDEERCVWKNI